MKKYMASTAAILLLAGTTGLSQDDVARRIILIGDAGEMNGRQQVIITDAASRVLPGKTTVLFLGNNIFPNLFLTIK